MYTLTAVVAFLGLAAAMPNSPPKYNTMSTTCHTTKTCKAVYQTTTKTIPYAAVETVSDSWRNTIHILRLTSSSDHRDQLHARRDDH